MKHGKTPSNPFVKLKNTFNTPDYIISNSQLSYGITVDGEFKGVEYLNLKDKLPEIEQFIPEKYRKHFGVLLMRINTIIPPHTDSDIKTTINFYIRTDDCLTQFYEFKNDNPTTQQVVNQTDGFLFEESDLNKIGGFIAQPNEAWLLDVTKPHSVIPQSEIKERLAVALSSKLSYDEVYEILHETGNL